MYIYFWWFIRSNGLPLQCLIVVLKVSSVTLQLWEVYKERRCIRTFIGKQSDCFNVVSVRPFSLAWWLETSVFPLNLFSWTWISAEINLVEEKNGKYLLVTLIIKRIKAFFTIRYQSATSEKNPKRKTVNQHRGKLKNSSETDKQTGGRVPR